MDEAISTGVVSSKKKILLLVLAVAVLIIVLISSGIITINTSNFSSGPNVPVKSAGGRAGGSILVEEEDLEQYINSYMIKQDNALRNHNTAKN